MLKIESTTLEQAYKDAASKLNCSVVELNVEVIQVPSSGFLGFFKKNAIIVAAKKLKEELPQEEPKKTEVFAKEAVENEPQHNIINDTILPQSFISSQDEDISEQKVFVCSDDVYRAAEVVEHEINTLFALSCFNIEKITVSVYDEKTLLIEFRGDDSALLIGKEGYRYKALSYMIFNWINAKYNLQIRLEIAEFLKNQEEVILKYLTTVYESIDRDGRAQTKTLDGVLIQIALKELRDRYTNKYVAIRTTKDGLKYIIVNENYSL